VCIDDLHLLSSDDVQVAIRVLHLALSLRVACDWGLVLVLLLSVVLDHLLLNVLVVLVLGLFVLLLLLLLLLLNVLIDEDLFRESLLFVLLKLDVLSSDLGSDLKLSLLLLLFGQVHLLDSFV
jgi:hypothetical protein